jgi:hypothetical protein
MRISSSETVTDQEIMTIYLFVGYCQKYPNKRHSYFYERVSILPVSPLTFLSNIQLQIESVVGSIIIQHYFPVI